MGRSGSIASHLARRLARLRIKASIAISSFLFAGAFGLVLTENATAQSAGADGHGNGNPPRITSTSLGNFTPTFVGPAATGCNSPGCSLLSGPFPTPSTAAYTVNEKGEVASPLALPALNPSGTQVSSGPKAIPLHQRPHPPAADPAPPSVSCKPLGPGCDLISLSSGGAVGVKGLNAVDSATAVTNVLGEDIEPADQGICAGNGYVVEANNVGEILIFNTSLKRVSAVIPFDTIMGLTNRGWSSGGDISCLYDSANGGHWFFTEFVSASTEASGGTFSGCFAGVPSTCYEGIAVTAGPDPFGPYNVYFLNSDYNPNEPGYPTLLNDFVKISDTRDAFLLFYDEFPLVTPGLGGGGFNGAQEFAIDKLALEFGFPVTLPNGKPNPFFNVAIENMGLLPTPDGTCFKDGTYGLPGFTCWYSVIPATPPDATQFDNSNGGSGFMLNSLDFYGLGDTRIAVFDWSGLENLNNPFCLGCSRIGFGAQLFSGVQYYYGEGFLAAQKAGPIPLGDECGAAGLSVGSPPPASCPENGIATNGDNFTQVSQAQNQLWGAISTEIAQTYRSGSSPEIHQGAAYWVIDTSAFDSSGHFTMTSQGYVSPAHEDLEFPAMAAEGGFFDGGNYGAIITFTLSGNGGPTGADNGGFYPSSAYGRLNSQSDGLLDSKINIADLGQSPEDGFAEYQGYPGPTRPRWGDYSSAIFLPWSGGKIFFATNYIQFPNCLPPAFTLTLGTCGGTRDGFANWGTSVNYVVP
jgi:hypothetical protein